MAILFAENHKKAWVDSPTEAIEKRDATGDIRFAYDTFTIGADADAGELPLVNGDVIMCQVIPARAKILEVGIRAVNAIGTSSFNVGFASAKELGDVDNTVTPVPTAFLTAWDPDANTSEVTDEDSTYFLVENAFGLFVTVSVVAAPAVMNGQRIEVFVKYVNK